jgi:DNA-directed RNA polymerase subunit L/DNA-directed RNA polymerase alpha subunit
MSQVKRPFTIRRPAAASATPSVFQNFAQDSRNILKFQITPTDVAYANALRRVILTEVETVAFRSEILEDGSTSGIKILKNSTPMSNEMLAHRIGLLPIHVSNPLEWDSSSHIFKMDVTNNSPDLKDVVASDIQVLRVRGVGEDPLLVPSVEFFHPDPQSRETALLAVLKGHVGTQEPETLSFEATATIGIGRENAQFIPVSQCAYKYSPDTNPERIREHFEAWLSTHKKIGPEELEQNPTKKQELEREFKTMEIARCFQVDERGEPNSFDFIVESIGVLDPVYIVSRALQVLQEKATYYASADTGDLPLNVQVRPADARMKGFDFVFQGEDHTLGNIFQAWMDANLMDTNEITYVGYKVPHPLKDEMVLRVGVEDGKEFTARTALVKAARGLAALFKGWAANWMAVGGTIAAPPKRSTIREALQMRTSRHAQSVF